MTPRKTTKRRSPGEGGAWPYQTKAGVRWVARGPVRMPDGTTKLVQKKGFLTKTTPKDAPPGTPQSALEWLGEQQAAGRDGKYIEPTKATLGAYGREVIEGLRIRPQTRASYLKNWRLHVEPYPIAGVPLQQVTGTRLTKHYRALETAGRKDHREGEGLSARTVRYLHTTIHKILAQAVKDNILARNPADAATPPTAAEAKPPEMACWSEAQLKAFLRWAEGEHGSQHATLWHVLSHTGMRRGELLALRWRDVDLDAGTVSIRRSAGIVRNAGEGAAITEGDTKSGKPRVITLDAGTVSVLRGWRKERGTMALQLVRDDALVVGDLEGQHRNPEHVSRQFKRDLTRCGEAAGADAAPVIRLHDLRHTHATLLLLAGVPVHVVSQRLGHASATITLGVYAHVLPGSDREAADLFARIVSEAGA